jgi:hypothetical protein
MADSRQREANRAAAQKAAKQVGTKSQVKAHDRAGSKGVKAHDRKLTATEKSQAIAKQMLASEGLNPFEDPAKFGDPYKVEKRSAVNHDPVFLPNGKGGYIRSIDRATGTAKVEPHDGSPAETQKVTDLRLDVAKFSNSDSDKGGYVKYSTAKKGG